MLTRLCAEVGELFLKLVSLLRELSNHSNPFPVFFHDVLVLVIAVDSCSLLPLAEHLHAVFKVIPLALVFFFNVSILVDLFLVKVFDKAVKLFRNDFL